MLQASQWVVGKLTLVYVAGRDGSRWSQGRQRRPRHDGQCLIDPYLRAHCEGSDTKQHTGIHNVDNEVAIVSACWFALFQLQEDEIRQYVRSEMNQHCGESLMLAKFLT